MSGSRQEICVNSAWLLSVKADMNRTEKRYVCGGSIEASNVVVATPTPRHPCTAMVSTIVSLMLNTPRSPLAQLPKFQAAIDFPGWSESRPADLGAPVVLTNYSTLKQTYIYRKTPLHPRVVKEGYTTLGGRQRADKWVSSTPFSPPQNLAIADHDGAV